MLGVFLSMAIVSCFALVILTPIFNLYYALIFFVVGSVYSYKIVQKNKIQFNNEGDSNKPRLDSQRYDIFGNPLIGHRDMRNMKNCKMPDRFLRGGIEEQPEEFESELTTNYETSSTGGSESKEATQGQKT